MIYAVTASTVEKVDRGTMHRQSPAFLLQASSDKEAEDTAERIVNPTGDPKLEVHVCVVPWMELPQEVRLLAPKWYNEKGVLLGYEPRNGLYLVWCNGHELLLKKEEYELL